ELSVRMAPTADVPPISYEYVEKTASFTPKGSWEARWKVNNGGLGLIMLDDSPSLVYSAMCPAESGTRKVPIIISRKKGKSATFTSIFFPYIRSFRVTASLNNSLIEVNHDGVTDFISIEPHLQGRTLLTDGRFAFARISKSEILTSRIINGKYLEWQGAYKSTKIEP
ncbi:MAG: hypothetical protein QME62_11660, partial [Armatimonadota bacterium]|nr:hypothetical protein [Armatimonadota bacterium]